MSKTTRHLREAAILFSLIALLGCDARSVNKEAFNSAKPELQQIWQTALAANKASDYVRANTNLVSLLSREITPAQLVAVQDALASLNERMYTAAAKGDPAAQKSLEALKLSSPKPARAR